MVPESSVAENAVSSLLVALADVVAMVTAAVSYFLLGGTPADGVLPESGDENVFSAFD